MKLKGSGNYLGSPLGGVFLAQLSLIAKTFEGMTPDLYIFRQGAGDGSGTEVPQCITILEGLRIP